MVAFETKSLYYDSDLSSCYESTEDYFGTRPDGFYIRTLFRIPHSSLDPVAYHGTFKVHGESLPDAVLLTVILYA